MGTVFGGKDWQKFMNYQRKAKKSENYLEALLKIFQPFFEPEVVLVSTFEQLIQWKACQKQREEELENNVPSK